MARGLMPTLYPDQVRGVEWLRGRPCGLLADAMGLGKTAVALGVPDHREPTLAVVPACLRRKWADEARAWRPDLAPSLVESVGGFRWPAAGEIVVMSPETLPATAGEIKRAVAELAADDEMLDFAARPERARVERRLGRARKARSADANLAAPRLTLIVDEAHEFASNKSVQTQRIRAVVKAVRKSGGRIVPLTATPVLNDPAELWGLLTTFGLHRDAYGDWFGFLRAAGGYEGRFGIEWGAPRVEDLAAGLGRVALRRLIEDFRPVPALLRAEVRRVDLDAAVAELTARAEEELRRRGADLWAFLPGGDPTGQPKGAGKVAFEMIARVTAALGAAKVPEAERIAEECEAAGEPVVVGTPFVAPARALGRRDEWACITGAESADRRHAIVAAYARGDLRGVAATIRAGGVGIDLIRGATVVVLDRDWVPSWTRQFIARVRRTGQTRAVRPIFVRAEHPIEVRRDEITRTKTALMEAVDAMAERPEVRA